MRAGVRLATLEKLAAADAFRSVQEELGNAKSGLDRRQALWEVKALANAPPLPLFEWGETRELGAEPQVMLPVMPLSEHVVCDYQTLRLSLKAHPMSFLREKLRAGRILACNDLRALRDGALVRVAGVVLVRQRPGSAKGVVFMTLEDETGVANAVVWPKTLEKYRKVVMGARLILITGRIQRHEDIIHVVSSRLEDKSDRLAWLSEWAAEEMKIPIANADEVKRPDPGSARGSHTAERNNSLSSPHPLGEAARRPGASAGSESGDRAAVRTFARGSQEEPRTHPRWAGHPRHERVIPPRGTRVLPKSRDFH
jgi:error-prone DNA polymerase